MSSELIISLVSIIVVGATAFLQPFLTGRENRKLARETNCYLKKKEVFDEFSRACSKYWGIIAIIPTINLFLSEQQRLVDTLRSLIEYEWDILKCIDEPSEYVDIKNMMVEIENRMIDLVKIKIKFYVEEPLSGSSNEDDVYKQVELIEKENKQFIEMTNPLQERLMEQHRKMKQALLKK